MKKISTVLSILILASLFGACSTEINEKKLAGTWKVTSFRSDIKDLPPAILAAGKKEALSTIYTLSKGDFLIIKSNLTDIKNGKWSYHKKTRMLEFYDSQDKGKGVGKYKIETISNTDMKWSQDIGEMGQIIMMLKKSKPASKS